jgi:signal transduction histidine kinase
MTGFGGLLLLMAFAGIDGVHTIEAIQRSNDTIRDQFLFRTRVLERIRADLYVSGTYVRDYLLERESGKAEGHRYSLLETRRDMDAALEEYRKLLNSQESPPFQILTGELESYWQVLQPVFEWSTVQRQRDGYLFLRDEVFPRRMSMLGIADRIGQINEQQLNTGKTQVEEAFLGFRRRLLATLGLTIGLGLLLASFSIHKILRLETETTEHYKEILQARASLKQLSARLVEAQENERRAISRELHDEVGQELTAILVEMGNMSTLVRAGNLESVRAKSDEIKKLLENSLKVVRNMSLLLRPSMLDDLGLVPALQWQAREVSRRSGLWVNVDAHDVSEDLPEEHKTCVYRLVQEALNNIVQHAHAHKVQIDVRQKPDELLLSIRDDGEGFDPKRDKGMGLLGMQERVSYLDGAFEVISRPGEGASVNISLPLAEHKPAERRVEEPA